MHDTTSETAVHRPATTPRNRKAGAALMASGVVYLTAEFIAAAAWSDPPYSYTHHFISNLGVRGPTTAFGQFMRSPLFWVMNSGFVLFGLVALTAVLLLRGLPGRRRGVVLALGVLLATGAVVLGFFPGSGDTAENGSTDFHSLGALLAFVSGNVLAIVLGRAHRTLGLSRGLGRGLVVAGIYGLVSIPAYLSVASSEAGILIGLVERGIVYPFLIGFIVLGAALRKG
ncbi:DUF998 domain-containing protein [Umezawaea tangerina]|uniref:Putative membrane protein n=1 Tax=Umezawaea tangerina TaxID=84725 RepID=A0A2T0T1J9_9PSEU|nr:DUF998 domain-containing protein [Umezawaea tangerina]PRY39558.1 putative membrane protein [Umezawaea tangerina]